MSSPTSSPARPGDVRNVPVQPAPWTTPQLLRTGAFAIWVADLIFLIALLAGGRAHRAAMKSIGKDSAPSIIAAQHIKSAIADMDANAANELLLKAGQKQAAIEAYKARRIEAGKALITAAENIAYGDKERVPIQNIQAGLGDYAELVQRVRDLHERNDPQALAAYRQAAEVVDGHLYPAADALDKANRDVLDRIYEGEIWNSLAMRGAVVATGLLLMFTLLSVQSFLSRRMRRTLNPALVISTAMVIGMLLYATTEYGKEMHEIRVAKQDAFESIHALWRARALAYAANALESRYLLDDARAAQSEQAFVTTRDGALKYIAVELNNITFPGEKAAATDTSRLFADYLKIDEQIRHLRQSGKRDAAIAMCLGSSEGQSNWAFARFDRALGQTLEINQKEFDRAVFRGSDELSNFDIKASTVCASIALLTLLGLWKRIQEYR